MPPATLDSCDTTLAGCSTLQAQLAGWEGQARLLRNQIEGMEQALASETSEVDLDTRSLDILDRLEKTWRGNFEGALAGIVSQGLTAVFGQEMKVIIEPTTKRGTAFLDVWLETEGLRTSIMKAKGGSVVNVMGVLLRLLLTMAHRPELRKFLMLDEPFSHVSAEYRSTLCQMLADLTKRLGFQVLVASHEEEMLDAADVAHQVVKDGKGTIRTLKTAEEAMVS